MKRKVAKFAGDIYDLQDAMARIRRLWFMATGPDTDLVQVMGIAVVVPVVGNFTSYSSRCKKALPV